MRDNLRKGRQGSSSGEFLEVLQVTQRAERTILDGPFRHCLHLGWEGHLERSQLSSEPAVTAGAPGKEGAQSEL